LAIQATSNLLSLRRACKSRYWLELFVFISTTELIASWQAPKAATKA
jgi:hypothetical protein